MSTFEFLVELKKQGIDIHVNGDRLKLNAPKGALTPVLKDQLVQRKAEILAFLQQADRLAGQTEVMQIAPMDRTGPLPLSPAQTRVWSLYRSEPESAALNVPVVWQLTGPLDVDALTLALNQVIARHETLRTIYPAVNGEPQAVVQAYEPVACPVVDLSDLPDPMREATRLVDEEATRPFTLDQTPPYRIVLYRLDAKTAVLLINFHQIIFDWGSFDTLVNEAAAFYNAQLAGEPLQLAPLPFQYIDFAHWQRQRLQGDRLAQLMRYWQDVLEPDYPLLQLPAQDQSAETAMGKVTFSMDAAMRGQLKTMAQENGTTLYTLLLAALKVLLSGYAAQDDVTVFTTTGQDRPELKKLIGLFANPIMLRTDVGGNPDFLTLLKRVRQTTMGAFSHQDLPFETMLRLFSWRAHPAHSNLFQVIFVYQAQSLEPLAFQGITSELRSAGEHLGGFDWRFFVEEVTDGVFVEIEYNAARYDGATMATVAAQYQTVLQRLLANTQMPLEALRPFSKTAVLPQDDAVTAVYVPPRDDIESTLVSLWQEALKLDKVGVHDDFFAIGGHSLMAAELFHQIDVKLGKKLPLSMLLYASTIEKIADAIRDDSTESAWRSLVPMRVEGNRPPLFLIHGAGGNVLLYRDLVNHLGEDQPVYGLQARGLDGQGQFVTNFEEMAALYIEEIRSVQPHGPYHLGGYCLGGTLSYEMAQQLQAQGEQVAMIAMLETFNIQANPKVYSGELLWIHRLQNLWFHAENILRLPFWDMVAFFKEKAVVQIERFKERRRIAADKRQEAGQNGPIHLVIDEVNDAAQEAYVPRPYDGPVTVFRPRKDFVGMEAQDYGWGDLVDAQLNVCQMDVNPKGMLVEPYVQDLASMVRQQMDTAQEPVGATA